MVKGTNKNMMERPARVLLVEEDPGAAHSIRQMLAEEDESRFELEYADRLAAGLKRLARDGIDLVLLDLTLPDSQGLRSLRLARDAAPEMPILVLLGLGDETLAVRTVWEGAHDYLKKAGLSGGLLARALRGALERKRAAQELPAAEERLRRMAEHIGEIVWWSGEAAQNFTNLLDTILVCNSVLLENLPEGDPLRNNAQEIRSAAERAAELARRLCFFLQKPFDSGKGAHKVRQAPKQPARHARGDDGRASEQSL